MAENDPLQEERFYWPQLDGLRSLAFTLVFISHLAELPVPMGVGWLAENGVIFLKKLMSWGWIGVELFFVLSAFLITTLLLKEKKQFQSISFKLFFIRRCLRIWPLYFFFLLLGYFLIPALVAPWNPALGITLDSTGRYPQMMHFLPAFSLFVGNFWLTGPHFVYPLYLAIIWSVCIEEQFYMAWGSLLTVIKDKVIPLFCIIALIATFLYRYSLQVEAPYHRVYYYNTLAHADSFLVDILLAYLIFYHPDAINRVYQSLKSALLFLPIALYILLAAFFPDIKENHSSIVYLMTLQAFGCGLFLLGVLYHPIGQKLFSLAPLIKTGRITYAMYIYHLIAVECASQITLFFLGQFVSLNTAYWIWGVYVLIAFTLTWLMAFASWHVLEKPFYKLRHRFSRIPSGFGG